MQAKGAARGAGRRWRDIFSRARADGRAKHTLSSKVDVAKYVTLSFIRSFLVSIKCVVIMADRLTNSFQECTSVSSKFLNFGPRILENFAWYPPPVEVPTLPFIDRFAC